MKTAALLPTPGDPLVAAYWCRNYEQVWRGEVDELYVLINGTTDAAAPIYREVGASVKVRDRMGHGQALDKLIAWTDADAVVLVEDDAFVRQPGSIRERMDRALAGEVIGCPRGGMDPGLEQAAREKWGPEPVGPDTSAGYGLWPCFFFSRTETLRALDDLRFESISWGGQTVPGIGVPGEHTDTMTAVAFQLRERHPITLDVNYKELWQKDLDGDPPYFHAGGFSNDPATARADIGMDNLEGRDWAHRFWWWRRIGHDYREHYQRAGLDPDYWTPIVEPWINWHD